MFMCICEIFTLKFLYYFKVGNVGLRWNRRNLVEILSLLEVYQVFIVI